jgi:predicted restriction endonuclease
MTEEQKEKKREQDKKYNLAHKEAIKERQARYYQANKETIKLRSRAWAKANPEKRNIYNKDRYKRKDEELSLKAKDRNAKKRTLVLEAYGGRCICCGESEPKFLTIDHISGGGRASGSRRSGTNLYTRLINENFPEGYQILCWNCNCSKGHKGGCPHQGYIMPPPKSRPDKRKVRQRVLKGYGHRCACCGESHEYFLTIDHVNGGGYQHRKTTQGANIMWEILKSDFPPEYRLLCYNCNAAEGIMGGCPHRELSGFTRGAMPSIEDTVLA